MGPQLVVDKLPAAGLAVVAAEGSGRRRVIGDTSLGGQEVGLGAGVLDYLEQTVYW